MSEKNIIDYELIWRRVHGLTSSEEDKRLNKWSEQSPEQKAYLQKVLNQVAIESNHDFEAFKNWEELDHELRKSDKRKSREFVWLGIAASIVAAIGFGVLFFDFQKPRLKEDIAVTLLPPGQTKATLITENGQQFNLSEESVPKPLFELMDDSFQLNYRTIAKHTAEVNYHTLIVPKGGEFVVTLEDGSRVWLNSSSSLRYPVSFKGQPERRIYLEGEGYLEVAKGNKPFKVVSGDQVVSVLGTVFNISTHDKNLITTTLVEGLVDVFPTSHPSNQLHLTPGYQSIFHSATMVLNKTKVDVSKYTAWRYGYFQFESMSLTAMAEVLMRWYDVDIKINNEEIRNIEFTGKVQRAETLKSILELVKAANEISYEIKGNIVEIQ